MSARPTFRRVPATPEAINTMLDNLRKAISWLVERQVFVINVETDLAKGAPRITVARPATLHGGYGQSVCHGCTLIWEDTPCA